MVEWTEAIKGMSVVGALLIFIWGLHMGYWVMGSEHKAMREERDFYRDRAWNGTDLADVSSRAVERRTTSRPRNAARDE